MRKEVRIPTILGIFALLVGLAAGVFLISSKQLLFLKANAGEEPVYVTLTNISDTSFSVSWTTNVPATGTIVYGTNENSLDQRTADDRDQESGTVSSYTTHEVTVGKFRPLTPSTDYYFVIQSGSTVYDNNGKAYRIKTAPLIRGQATGTDSVSGKVVNPDGTPAEGALVYLVLPNMTPQSTLVTTSGNWIIPLGLARSADLSSLAVYDQQAAIAQIFIQGTESGQTANASAVLSNTRPTPLITLGQQYDWRTPGLAENNTQGSPSPTSLAQASPAPSSEPRGSFSLEALASPSATTQDVTIKYPGVNEQVTSQRPAIVGTGPKGTKLSVMVESTNPVSGSATIGADGTWEWDVPADLAPGKHTVTVTYTDPLGQLKKIVKNFTVLAAETSVPAFVATPSATLAPTPTPTPTAVPRAAIPATGSGIPVSGDTAPTALLMIFGILSLVVGGWTLTKYSRTEA